jgi:hypothetical protein
MKAFLNKYIRWIFLSSFALNVITFLIIAFSSTSNYGIVEVGQWVLFTEFFLQIFICISSFVLIVANIITDKRALAWWLVYFLITLAIITFTFIAIPRC